MRPISAPTCEVCGEDIGQASSGIQAQLCLSCQATPPHFDKAVAYGAYEGELRELVHLLKYEHVESAVNLLGRMLGEAIQKLELDAQSMLVVPVPLHRSKKRERGFNQAQSIIHAAWKYVGIPDAQLVKDLLERTRSTVSQIGLTRSQRAENMRGAFRVAHLSRVEGKQVLLVDDVMTTGTTANECARVLRKAGAQRVWVATVARTMKEGVGSFRVDTELRKRANGGSFELSRTAKIS